MRYILGALVLSCAAWAAEGPTFVRTFSVGGPVTLDVVTGAGGITVKPGGGATVVVRGTIHADESWQSAHQKAVMDLQAQPPVTQSGNEIHVGPIADEEVRRHVAIAYEITTPAQTKVQARSGAGAVAVDGVEGPVDAKTGAGGIRISHINHDATVSTGAGKVELDGVKGKVVAHTGAGSIEGRDLGGPVKANTGTGSVHLEQSMAAPVEAHTGTGSLNVRVPSQAAFDLTARTGMGTVTVDPALAVSGSVEKREVKGKVRGGGPLLDLSTGMGSVRVQ